jgi:hypothetical protein
MLNLRLVHNTDREPLSFEEASDQAMDQRVLRSEAAAFAALIGSNAYSDFILKHGYRPDPPTAAIIGKLIGQQVRAIDGTMQPRRTVMERAAFKESRRAQKQHLRKLAHVARLCAAIDELAVNEDDPASIIEAISSHEEPKITKNLEKSLEWLSRFAQEWQGRGKQQETGGNPQRPTDRPD